MTRSHDIFRYSMVSFSFNILTSQKKFSLIIKWLKKYFIFVTSLWWWFFKGFSIFLFHTNTCQYTICNGNVLSIKNVAQKNRKLIREIYTWNCFILVVYIFSSSTLSEMIWCFSGFEWKKYHPHNRAFITICVLRWWRTFLVVLFAALYSLSRDNLKASAVLMRSTYACNSKRLPVTFKLWFNIANLNADCTSSVPCSNIAPVKTEWIKIFLNIKFFKLFSPLINCRRNFKFKFILSTKKRN